jgi:hypothetical protein
MKYSLSVLALFFCESLISQQLSRVTPFYNRDSVTVSAKIIDDMGNPVENAYVLFSPFYMKKFDVTWYEKDTTLSDKNGDFTVKCTRSQFFDNTLYFEKSGYFTTRHFLPEDSGRIAIDTTIVLHDRQKHWFDTREINTESLGMTVAQELHTLNRDISQTYLAEARNSDSVHAKTLRVEAADSSMVLFIVEDYKDPLKNRLNILSKQITGIGIAFTNGEKRFFGTAKLYKRKVYNEYCQSKRD